MAGRWQCPLRVRAAAPKYSRAGARASVTRVLLACLLLAGGLSGSDPVAAAAPPRTLRVAFPVAETGLDPQALGDVYSYYVCNAIFDPL